MTRRSLLAVGAALAGIVCLLFSDGWLSFPSPAPRRAMVPETLSKAFRAAAENLSRRAETLARMPEVARSLEGGGIAVNRGALFAAARQALQGADNGTWIALTDAAGNVHAWWGEAPASLAGFVASEGIGTRWSATTLTLLHRRSVGAREPGVVYSARTFPVEAPEFGRALNLAGEALRWEPVAAGGSGELLGDGAGHALIFARRASPGAPPQAWRDAVFAVLLFAVFVLFGRRGDPLSAGAALTLLFLGFEARSSGAGHVLSSWHILVLALGPFLLPIALSRVKAGQAGGRGRAAAGYGLLLAAFLAATSLAPPDLGTRPALSSLLVLAAMTALVLDALAITSSARPGSSPAGWMTLSILATAAGITAALALVSPLWAFPFALAALTLAVFELWARAIGAAPAAGGFRVPRLLTGAGLLVLLIATPLSEAARTRHAVSAAAAIRLPDPTRASRSGVSISRRNCPRPWTERISPISRTASGRTARSSRARRPSSRTRSSTPRERSGAGSR